MCCGCYVDQCCCGCTSHKVGVILWGIVEAVLHLTYLVVLLVFIGWPGTQAWSILVILADIGLLIGAEFSNDCLITTWLVVDMIGIIVLYINFVIGLIFLAVPAYILVLTNWACNGFNLNGDICSFDIKGMEAGLTVAVAMAPIMATFGIYFWIMVNSYRKKMTSSITIQPME